MSNNTVTSKYLADTSQTEIALDKITAKYTKLVKTHEQLISSSTKGTYQYGNSWNAARSRVEYFTKALKEAKNAFEFDAASAKLNAAREEFEKINASVSAVTASQKEVVVETGHMANSYNDLANKLKIVREQMGGLTAKSDDLKKLANEEDRLKREMEGFNNVVAQVHLSDKMASSIKTTEQLAARISDLKQMLKLMDEDDPARGNLVNKIKALEAGYGRLTKAAKENASRLKENAQAAKQASDSIKTLEERIALVNAEAQNLSPTSQKFQRLTDVLNKLNAAREKARNKLRGIEDPVGKTVSAVEMNSLAAKRMQRDYLQDTATNLPIEQFTIATAKIRELNAEIQKMEGLFKKAEQELVIDAVAIKSIDGLSMRIQHVQEQMNKLDSSRPTFEFNSMTGTFDPKIVAGASDEYRKMAMVLHTLKKELAGLKEMQNIPVTQIVTVRMSYDALREAIERTRKARDAALKGSDEFKGLDKKLARLESGYKRLTSAQKKAADESKRKKFDVRAAGGSEEGLQKQIEFLEGKRGKLGPGAEFDRLNGIIAKLQVRLKAVKDDAKKAGEALSEAATAPIGSFRRVEYELKKAKDELEMLTYGTKEYIAQSRKVDEIAAAYRKLDKDINKTVKAQKESNGIAGAIKGQLTSLTAQYIGIHEVVSLITQEWEKQKQIQFDIAARAMTSEGALVAQSANIGVENIATVRDWARGNQVDLLSSQADLINLVGSAVSGGAAKIDDAMNVTAAAMRMNVGNIEMANEMLQGGITIGRLNNSNDFEAAFGQLRSSSKASQAVNEAEFIGNVLGKAAALTRGRKNMDGMTTERSLEFITAASRIQVDRTGDTSSTNMASIFQRMDEFVPELKKTLKDKTVSKVDKATIDTFMASRSFDEKLRMLQSNRDLGNQFIDKQKTGGPKELAFTLIQNSQATAQIMKESSEAVVSFADGAKVFQDAVANIRKEVPNLVVQKQSETTVENMSSDAVSKTLASARVVWENSWKDINRTGPDPLFKANEEARVIIGKMLSPDGNKPLTEIEEMVKSLKYQAKVQRLTYGDERSALALEAQLAIMRDLLETMKGLRQDVAVRPAAPPVNRAPAIPRPAPRAPAVR